MKMLILNADDLAVTSFEISPAQANRGTVVANGPTNGNTCPQSCGFSCDVSCDISCDPSCISTCPAAPCVTIDVTCLC